LGLGLGDFAHLQVPFLVWEGDGVAVGQLFKWRILS
jgi:hypothetical protein